MSAYLAGHVNGVTVLFTIAAIAWIVWGTGKADQ